jgi:NADH dehydrogenase FAD-containing subunit
LQLNEHLQSVSNPTVYAAGDAAGRSAFDAGRRWSRQT